MKRNFNLQLFAEPVQGSRIIYLFRILEENATQDGAKIAYVTENSMSIDKSADSTATKDGAIRTPGVAEVEVESTSIFQRGDSLIGRLKSAMLNGKLLEIWRVNLDDPVADQENQFAGTYYQGYLTSFEESATAEDFVEYSLTFGVNGNGVDGSITVPTAQQEEALYGFADTPKTGA